MDDPSWKILGTSVQLDQSRQVLIREANLVTQLENINSFPGIKNWIGDRATMAKSNRVNTRPEEPVRNGYLAANGTVE